MMLGNKLLFNICNIYLSSQQKQEPGTALIFLLCRTGKQLEPDSAGHGMNRAIYLADKHIQIGNLEVLLRCGLFHELDKLMVAHIPDPRRP